MCLSGGHHAGVLQTSGGRDNRAITPRPGVAALLARQTARRLGAVLGLGAVPGADGIGAFGKAIGLATRLALGVRADGLALGATRLSRAGGGADDSTLGRLAKNVARFLLNVLTEGFADGRGADGSAGLLTSRVIALPGADGGALRTGLEHWDHSGVGCTHRTSRGRSCGSTSRGGSCGGGLLTVKKGAGQNRNEDKEFLHHDEIFFLKVDFFLFCFVFNFAGVFISIILKRN